MFFNDSWAFHLFSVFLFLLFCSELKMRDSECLMSHQWIAPYTTAFAFAFCLSTHCFFIVKFSCLRLVRSETRFCNFLHRLKNHSFFFFYLSSVLEKNTWCLCLKFSFLQVVYKFLILKELLSAWWWRNGLAQEKNLDSLR